MSYYVYNHIIYVCTYIIYNHLVFKIYIYNHIVYYIYNHILYIQHYYIYIAPQSSHFPQSLDAKALHSWLCFETASGRTVGAPGDTVT